MSTPATAPKVAAPAAASKPAPKAKAERKAPVVKTCACGVPDKAGAVCNAQTRSKFAPGHDAKLVGHLTREVVAGKMTREQAVEQVKTKSGDSKLLVAKIGSAVDRELDKAAKAKAKTVKAQKGDEKMQFAKDQAAEVRADRQAKEQAGI